MSQSPQSHGETISRLGQESQAGSPPAREFPPRPYSSPHLPGWLRRAGMVIGILLIFLVSQGTAAPPAPADKAAPQLKTALQGVLLTLRDAMVQKDFDKYVSVYARNIRGNNMVRSWDRYDTLKLEVAVDKVTSIDPDNAIAAVTWQAKTKDQRTGEVSSRTSQEEIRFTRKQGKWFILPDEDVP